MFAAGLRFILLEKYLDIPVHIGLVNLADSTYVLTESGIEFLERYKNFRKHCAEVEAMVEALGSEQENMLQLSKRNQLVSLSNS